MVASPKKSPTKQASTSPSRRSPGPTSLSASRSATHSTSPRATREEEDTDESVQQDAEVAGTDGNKPTTRDMVLSAIAAVGGRKGASVAAIKKYMADTFDVDVQKRLPIIKTYLHKAANTGELTRVSGSGSNGSFKIVNQKAPKKPAATKSKTTVRKAASKTSTKQRSKSATRNNRAKSTGRSKSASRGRPSSAKKSKSRNNTSAKGKGGRKPAKKNTTKGRSSNYRSRAY